MTKLIMLPSSVYLMALAFGLGTTVAVISVSIAGLIGAELAPHLSLATLPYGLQFVGIMLSAFVSSLLQAKYGRKRVVFGAGCLGILAGLFGLLTVHYSSFVSLCITHFLFGVFLANIGLLRFAALDLTPKALHGKALSIVMFGGTFAGLLGPFVSRNGVVFFENLNAYQVSYLAVSLIAVVILVMVAFLKFQEPKSKVHTVKVPLKALFSYRLYCFAIICGGVAYSLMNMMMINTSIQMKANGFGFNTVNYFIQVHVLAMFIPSLFNMKIIGLLGIKQFLALGLVLQLLASAVFIFGQTQLTFLLGLLALGLSWNILYTSGSYLVGQLFSDSDLKFKAQGVNDFFVGMASAVGALSAGVVLGVFGWDIQQLIAIAMTLALTVFYIWVRPELK